MTGLVSGRGAEIEAMAVWVDEPCVEEATSLLKKEVISHPAGWEAAEIKSLLHVVVSIF